MSTIIAPLGIDDDSLSSDFGTIAIYTCPVRDLFSTTI